MTRYEPPGSDELQPQFMGDLSTLPPHAHGNRSLTLVGNDGDDRHRRHCLRAGGGHLLLSRKSVDRLAAGSAACPIYCRMTLINARTDTMPGSRSGSS